MAKDVEVVETEKIELKTPLFLLGFIGPGLVGGIAVSHIIGQMKMKKIAHIRSRQLPPAVVFIDGKLRHPFRIYSNEEGTLCVVVCDLPVPSGGLYPIASVLLDWIESKGGRELVVLDGIGIRGILKERKTFCIAEPEKLEECERKGVEMIAAVIIGGIAGSILNECLTRKITGVAFLTQAVTFVPDPEGAVLLIQTLNKVYDLNIDTQELLRSAKQIKHQLREFAESHRRMKGKEEMKDKFVV